VSFLRSLSLVIRSIFAGSYPVFCCCASCGEIKAPLGNRLCASLKPSFVVDAVLTPGAEQLQPQLKRCMPRLRAIHAKPVQEIPYLAEHYLLIKGPDKDSDMDILSNPVSILDFFTPNGLPLYYKKQPDLPIVPQVREYAAGDIKLSYAQARAVPVYMPVYMPGNVPEDVPKDMPEDKQAPASTSAKNTTKTQPLAPDFFLVTPKTGSWLTRLKRSALAALVEVHPASAGCGPCGNLISSLGRRGYHEHATQPDFPIDVVYTWVNGADPEHQARRAAYLPKQQIIHESALEAARFRDNNELLYSLRALEQFAPWVCNVILVTDNQVPAWLRKNHPKIRIVDHKEFIPKQYLPTFNSHVIEAYLHNIPDLAEHYIYLNDDVFLARPCRKTDFFLPNGLPLSFIDWRKRRIVGYHYTGTPHAKSYFNTLKILKNRGVRTDPKYITAHGPYAETRSNAQAAFNFYQNEIEAFADNRFRTTNEICMYSHALPLLLYYQKKLAPCDERYYYVQTMRPDRVTYYQGLLNSRADNAAPLFFCINDVSSKRLSKYWRDDLHTFLEAYFSERSSFEDYDIAL
jgi:hypothetical protein